MKICPMMQALCSTSCAWFCKEEGKCAIALLPSTLDWAVRIAITKPSARSQVNADACIGCRKCISSLGCPAIGFKDGKAVIDQSVCTGCTLCEQVCPVNAIAGGVRPSMEGAR